MDNFYSQIEYLKEFSREVKLRVERHKEKPNIMFPTLSYGVILTPEPREDYLWFYEEALEIGLIEALNLINV